nr:protein FAM71B-like [Vicugna pacos]
MAARLGSAPAGGPELRSLPPLLTGAAGRAGDSGGCTRGAGGRHGDPRKPGESLRVPQVFPAAAADASAPSAGTAAAAASPGTAAATASAVTGADAASAGTAAAAVSAPSAGIAASTATAARPAPSAGTAAAAASAPSAGTAADAASAPSAGIAAATAASTATAARPAPSAGTAAAALAPSAGTCTAAASAPSAGTAASTATAARPAVGQEPLHRRQMYLTMYVNNDFKLETEKNCHFCQLGCRKIWTSGFHKWAEALCPVTLSSYMFKLCHNGNSAAESAVIYPMWSSAEVRILICGMTTHSFKCFYCNCFYKVAS